MGGAIIVSTFPVVVDICAHMGLVVTMGGFTATATGAAIATCKLTAAGIAFYSKEELLEGSLERF